jgi:conjugal transfer/entry exclusion protein
MARTNIEEINKQMADEKETAEILKNALKIVDKLSKMDVDDISHNDDDMDELEELIDKAKKLSKHRLWKLK